jgi:hypothetical protein
MELGGESLNIKNENINKLKELFPQIFSEGKIDFDKLKNELGEFVDNQESLTYLCGAIEDKMIRSEICQILEGGEEAFKKREQKYNI